MAWGLKGGAGPYDGGKGNSKGADAQPSDNLYVTGLPPGTDDEFLKALFQPYGTVMQCKVLQPKVPGSTMHALVRFSTVEEATTIMSTVTGGMVDGSNEPLKCTYATQKQPSWGDAGKGAGGDSWGAGGGSWGKAGKANSWGDAGKGSWGDAGKGSWGDAGKGDAGKGDGGKGDGGKGKKGKSTTTSMDVIMQAFGDAKCLPGAEFGNDHNNVYVFGLPGDCTDLHLYKLFAPFGALTPTGVKAMTRPDGSCKGFGFVNFIDATEMQAAVTLLNGAQLPDGSILKVEAK